MSDPEKPSEEKWDLTELDARLAQKEESTRRAARPKLSGDMSGFGLAMKIAADLMAGIIVCVLLAWAVATWLLPEYRVLILALGSLAGIGIGLYNVWRGANQHF